MPRGVKGSGLSLVRTDEHPFKGAGKWFRTQEEAEAYRVRNNLLKRAKRAGFGTSDEEIQKFLQVENRLEEERKRARAIEARERQERDRLRQQYGIHPRGQMTKKAKADAVREEFRTYLARANQARTTDKERVDYIRKLYSQSHLMSKEDLLYRIARVIGVI